MLQLMVIRFVMNFVFGMLSHVRTIVWLLVVGTVIGYGYLVSTNGLDFFAGFDQVKTYAMGAWALLQNSYADLKGYLASH